MSAPFPGKCLTCGGRPGDRLASPLSSDMRKCEKNVSAARQEPGSFKPGAHMGIPASCLVPHFLVRTGRTKKPLRKIIDMKTRDQNQIEKRNPEKMETWQEAEEKNDDC